MALSAHGRSRARRHRPGRPAGAGPPAAAAAAPAAAGPTRPVDRRRAGRADRGVHRERQLSPVRAAPARLRRARPGAGRDPAAQAVAHDVRDDADEPGDDRAAAPWTAPGARSSRPGWPTPGPRRTPTSPARRAGGAGRRRGDLRADPAAARPPTKAEHALRRRSRRCSTGTASTAAPAAGEAEFSVTFVAVPTVAEEVRAMSLLTGRCGGATSGCWSPARRSRWSATASTPSRWPSLCCSSPSPGVAGHDGRRGPRAAGRVRAAGRRARRPVSRRTILVVVRPRAAGRRGHARRCCSCSGQPAVWAAGRPGRAARRGLGCGGSGVQRDRAGPRRRGRAGARPTRCSAGSARSPRWWSGRCSAACWRRSTSGWRCSSTRPRSRCRPAACCCCDRSPTTRPAGRGRCRGRTSARASPTSGERRGWRSTCCPGS